MKQIIFITLLFVAFALQAQTTETDSTIVVDDIEISKSDTLQSGLTATGEDTLIIVALDSLVVEIRLGLIADADRSLSYLDSEIAKLEKAKLEVKKEKREQQRKLKKTRKKGFKTTITRIVEADEIPSAGKLTTIDALKTVLKARDYKDYKELSNTYRTTDEIRRVANELELDTKGRKADIAKRIFNYLNN